jgi:hypothetical protein
MIMMKMVLAKMALATICAAGFIVASAPPAKANEQARRACCTEMGGTYGPIRGGRNTCTGVGRGAEGAFYACVQRKTGQGGGKKR